MQYTKPFKHDDTLPELYEIHEQLEQYENIDLTSPQFDLSHRDRMICLLHTVKDMTGMTNQEIAEQFGLQRSRLYKITKKPEAKRFIEHINEQLFAELFQDTVRELRSILKTSHSEGNKVKVAEMILKSRGMFKEQHELTVKQEETYDVEAKRKEIIDMDIDSLE
ncbi:phBC6A51 family helix-turn-helix protein [Thalassobacillus sp. CUG 92003]|uniref:phBC6A51 family helix-turn-helix protein n=1 Tax=Thalassobacillus sp. CUG 92003 TaxID=2736641 RepID=UPI0015E634F7